MRWIVLAVIVCVGCAAMAGCQKKGQARAEAPDEGQAPATASGKGAARFRGPSASDDGQAKPAAPTAAAGVITRATSSQPVHPGTRIEYLDGVQERVSDAEDKVRELRAAVGKLTEQQSARIEALLKDFDDATLDAYEKRDEYIRAPQSKWKERKVLMEKALTRQQQAVDELQQWLSSIK